jgi:hypothetical protein
MHSPSQLARNLLKFRLHTVAARSPLEEELSSKRLADDERETQEIEGLRFTEPAPLAVGRRMASKLDQAGLLRMQRQ